MATGTKAFTSSQGIVHPRFKIPAHQGAGPTRKPSVLSSTRSLTRARTKTKPNTTMANSQRRIGPSAKAGNGKTRARYSNTKVLRISPAIG